MKRLHIIFNIALALAMTVATKANAQAGLDSLATSYVFQPSAKISKTKETHIEGNDLLAARGMTVFRSVNYTTDDKEQSEIFNRLERDVRRAANKEIQRREGKLTFALLQYRKPHSNQKSYLIFHSKDMRQCVCVYIEGKLSVAQIKEMFYK